MYQKLYWKLRKEEILSFIKKNTPEYYRRNDKWEILNYNLLSSATKEQIENTLSWNNTVIEIQKTDSKLFVLLKNGNLIFVNIIGSKQAEIWQEIHDANIPTAPIYGTPIQKKNWTKTIYSRYCGESIAIIWDFIHSDMLVEIEKQRAKILQEIEEKGIHHWHAHLGNFVVEFINKDYYQEQIKKNMTINTIEYNAKYFVDAKTASKNLADYKIIVRIIDMDAARKVI